MASRNKFVSNLAFVDLLFNILIGVVFLFLIALIMINPKAKNGNVIVPAEYHIILTWHDKNRDDFDLWVSDPAGNTVSYQTRDVGIMNLDRDDLGLANDYVIVNDEFVTVELNREVVSLRGIIPGEYGVAVMAYRKNTDNNGELLDPEVDVTVEVIKLNPYAVVYKQTLKFSQGPGEVRNFYKFRITDNPRGWFADVGENILDIVRLNRTPAGAP